MSANVLAIMGVTGAGKSSFIKLATGDPSVRIGHGQAAETKSITSYGIEVRGSKFTLVDTPGFDDEELTDSDVLQMLVSWLTSSYKSGQKLSAILYLHRISDAKMRGSSLRNLAMFRKLIGDNFYKNVTLGTTCWSLVPFSVGLERESELKTNGNFWKTMLSNGARMERIPDSMTEARNLVYRIASREPVTLETQRDVVDRGISFGDLAVTRAVNYELEKLRKEQAALLYLYAEQLAREKKEREEQMAILTAQNQRVREALERELRCFRKKPFGRCNNAYCDNKLRRYAVTWHCCSCNPGDEYNAGDTYWHCGPCGNDCGNAEHPLMSRIDNDNCVVM